MSRVHVFFHDRCFDGISSAATFTRFFREKIDPSAAFSYRGLTHGAGTSWTPELFTDADAHACVDFRYSPDPRLTWWFDHHQSAFERPGDEAHFRADTSGKKFFDPKAQSCTKFLARTAAATFGFDATPLSELVDWADLIDGAKFPDAATAVALEHPALKLMLLCEGTTDGETLPKVITELSQHPMSAVVASPLVRDRLDPLLKTHFATVALVRARATIDRGVVFFDVADEGVDNFNKFIAYEQFPEARYTVAVSRGKKRSKISVGSNPWHPEWRRHNIAEICEKFGGGGHAVVGAASFAPEDLDKARAAAAEIVATLQA